MRGNAEFYARRGRSGGCLIVLAAALGSPECGPERDHVAGIRRRGREALRRRLERAVAEGDLPAGTDTTRVASFYANVLHGLSIEARDGASRRALHAIVDAAMDAWEAVLAAGGDLGRSRGRHAGGATAGDLSSGI